MHATTANAKVASQNYILFGIKEPFLFLVDTKPKSSFNIQEINKESESSCFFLR